MKISSKIPKLPETISEIFKCQSKIEKNLKIMAASKETPGSRLIRSGRQRCSIVRPK